MICLGIDTSCYTTSVALADERGPLASARRLLPVAQGEAGLRQSDAVFLHSRQLPGLVEQVFSECRARPDCVCASAAPREGEESYMPVFLVGEGTGRALAAALDVPFVRTTHQQGHLRAARVDSGLASDRFLALHLSGGTTDVLLCEGGRVTPLGSSLDLHAGQLVDRVGVRLGLPFPAGPALEALATSAPSGLSEGPYFPEDRADPAAEASVLPPVSGLVPSSVRGASCHLSGAEAQLMRLCGTLPPAAVAAETYDVLCRTILKMLDNAARDTGVHDALLFGGVMSSALLRRMCLQRVDKRRVPLRLYFGRPELSGDNAVGVALIGAERMVPHGADS